jgi:hypothetical protein
MRGNNFDWCGIGGDIDWRGENSRFRSLGPAVAHITV